MSILRRLRARIARLFTVRDFQRPDEATPERQRKQNELELELRERERWRR